MGVRLKMDPGWHSYWRNPGDSGSPTTVKWTLPEGWRSGETRWPAPQRILLDDGLVSFGYEREAVLLVDLTPPLDAHGTVKIAAEVSWVACQKECVYGTASMNVTLSALDQTPPISDDTAAVLAAKEQEPGPLQNFRFKTRTGGVDIVFPVEPSAQSTTTVMFFPYEATYEYNLLQPAQVLGAQVRVPVPQAKGRIRGVLVASRPGLWPKNATAKVIDAEIPTS